jgi:hypothetical protein
VIHHDLWFPEKRFEARENTNISIACHGVPPRTDSPDGIYAYSTDIYAMENSERFCYRGTLLGKVNLWGIIQKHQFGYRAQFAYPLSLIFGICCICKRKVSLKKGSYTIGWNYYHFSDDFSVNGFLCSECNEKYYSLEASLSCREMEQLINRYRIAIE